MRTSPGLPTSFPDLLRRGLRGDAGRPLVTFYDDATGERVELSVTTYANWVAKTASFVQDELGLERGDLVLVDLPTHWLGAVWVGAVWSGGQTLTDDTALADEAALVVCGPAGVETYADHAPAVPVVALSLRPLGAPFSTPLPSGVVDYGAVVLAQPDVFVAVDPPDATDPGWRDSGGTATQAELVAGSCDGVRLPPGGRLLTDLNPSSRSGLDTVLAPLVLEGGTVWVAHPDEDRWQHRYDEERATSQLRGSGR